MKPQKTKDPFHTESWCLERTTDPYRVFALCFYHAAGIDELRKTLLQVFLFIEQNKGQTGIPPYTVYSVFMAINSIIDAAHFIYKHQRAPATQPAKTGQPDEVPPGQKSFAAYFMEDGEADLLKVAEQFFCYQTRKQWKSSMHLALYHGQTEGAIGVEMDGFSVWFYLTRLLEAAYSYAKDTVIYRHG